MCPARGVHCQPAAPCRSRTHVMLGGNSRPGDPTLHPARPCRALTAGMLCSSGTHAASERAEPPEHTLPSLPGRRAAHFGQLSPLRFAAELVALREAMATLPRHLSYQVLARRGVPRGRAGVTRGCVSGRCSLTSAAASSAPARLRPSRTSWMQRGLPSRGITAEVPGQGSPALTPQG